MKFNNIKILALVAFSSIAIVSCDKDNENDFMLSQEESTENLLRNGNFSGSYYQEDQMGRPAINTVFVASGSKDAFNVTVPSEQGSTYQALFQSRLLALNPGYSTNALGLDAATFTGALATDVLTASLIGTTTFFDGTNVLTGRTLADDVISVELLLIFGGPDGSENPALTDDHVDANDKSFLTSFPYMASPH